MIQPTNPPATLAEAIDSLDLLAVYRDAEAQGFDESVGALDVASYRVPPALARIERIEAVLTQLQGDVAALRETLTQRTDDLSARIGA